MDEFIKLLNKDYELVHYQMKDKAIIFHIQSGRTELTCVRSAVQSPYAPILYMKGKFRISRSKRKRLFYW